MRVVLASYRGGMDGKCQGLGKAQRMKSRVSLEMQGLEDQTGMNLAMLCAAGYSKTWLSLPA